MRKMLYSMFLTTFLVLAGLACWAQDRNISGKVSGEDLRPLAGVTVAVRNTQRQTITDQNGNFTIVAKTGDVLLFTATGRKTNEFVVGNTNSVDLVMSARDNVMSEIVVTAMDQRRNPRDLGFSTSTVKGGEVAETQRENFLNGLQGRIAGVTVNATGGAAGASSQIVLRGFNSLSLDNSPLFVIDGIIVDNSTLNETSNGGTQLGLASDRPNRGNDYSNRMSDLNPNDIESITVLKGPEATALYGSQASSGAIIITTKKGTKSGRVNVAYDNSFRTQTLTRTPKIISTFDGGTNGAPGDLFTAFGPAFPAGTTTYDNVNNFFRTGFAQTHNMAVDYGKGATSYRFSGSYFDQKAVVPTNTYRRYTARFTSTTKLKKVEITPSLSLISATNDKPLRGASGYLLNLLVWPADDDVRNYMSTDGLKRALYNANPNGELDNPFYSVFKNRSGDQTNRFIGSLGINYTPFEWLTFAGRFGYETYHTTGYTRYDSMSFYVTRAQKGQQDNYYTSYYGYNHTLTATARRNFGDFGARLLVGNMWQDYETQQYAVVGTNLKNQSSTDSNNTDPSTRIRLSNAIRSGLPNYRIYRQSAYFGEVSLNWKSILYLTYSHRFEQSSVFPPDFRKYNYPAASVSFIVSDLIPALKNSDAFGFWKLRGSIASTARSSQPYANQAVFNYNTGSGGGFYYSFTNTNLLLRPEKQKTFELGTEMRFIKNRLSLDFTYYNTRNSDLILEQFRSSYGTGFVLNTLNFGATQNKGLELTLDGTPINGKNFKWNTRISGAHMWNRVNDLPANVPEFYQSDTWLYANARGGLTLGGSTTTITAYGYLRNDAGDIIINPTTGLPVLDNNFRVRGDRNPDFTIGFFNNLSYKGVRLSFLWDLKVGGDIFNATDRYLTTLGRSPRTADRLTPRVIKGVLQDGFENTKTPTQNTIAITPYYNQTYYTTMPEEEFIEKDVNWLRLRDISLSYTFPTAVVKKWGFIRTLGVFATANDLVLITNYTGADPQINGNTAGSRGVGGFGFDYGNIGTPVSFNFGLRANF